MDNNQVVYNPVLRSVFEEQERWVYRMNFPTVQRFNQIVETDPGRTAGVIFVSEAFQERKIIKVADDIAANREVKIILIAGPSSSGKSSFIQRLRVQLGVHAVDAVTVSMDNYFVDRQFTPKKADGSYDFDCPEAVDLALFLQQMNTLIEGGEVALPYFDFKSGKRAFAQEKLKLKENQVLMVEGIHALNKELVHFADERRVARVYIAVLNPLELPDGSNVKPADIRLIRRIVRDNRRRGFGALATLKQWSNVLEAEQRYIYPTADNADYIINTSLVYELSVLKPLAEALLQPLRDSSTPEGELAQYLLRILENVLPLAVQDIPLTSLMREFVGGSSFQPVL